MTRPFAGGNFNNGSQDSWSYLNCNEWFTNTNWNYASRPLIADDPKEPADNQSASAVRTPW